MGPRSEKNIISQTSAPTVSANKLIRALKYCNRKKIKLRLFQFQVVSKFVKKELPLIVVMNQTAYQHALPQNNQSFSSA
jgi:hypothetical protein